MRWKPVRCRFASVSFHPANQGTPTGRLPGFYAKAQSSDATTETSGRFTPRHRPGAQVRPCTRP